MRPIGWRKRFRPSPPWDAGVFWAIDLETTGLDETRDEILAIGMVPIRRGVICYGERLASLVRPAEGQMPSRDGVGVHHILPAEVRDAPAFATLVGAIDARLREGVVLMHHAPIDLAFLSRAYRRVGRPWPRLHVVDTLDLFMRLYRQRHRFTPHPPPPRTTLSEARRDVELPPHEAHDALSDALATAELFLVLRSRLGVCTLRGLG